MKIWVCIKYANLVFLLLFEIKEISILLDELDELDKTSGACN